MRQVLPKGWGSFLRRRARVLVSTFAVCTLLSLWVIYLLPASYVARATVAPAGPHYEGPVLGLKARVTSREVLTRVAEAAGFQPQDVGIAAHLAGMPLDLADRLRAPGHDLIDPQRDAKGQVEELVVRARGLTETQAKAAADDLAQRLVREDESLVGARKADAGSTPLMPDYPRQLTQLRQKYPLLEDKSRLTRFQEGQRVLASSKVELESLAVRLRGQEEKEARLRAQVDREGAQAYARFQAEILRKARLAKQRRERVQKEKEQAPQQALASKREPALPSRLQLLQARLRKLLSKLTRKHPDVRNLLRELRLERERLADLPPPAPLEKPTKKAAAEPPAREPVAAPASGALPVADEAGPAQPVVPARFRHAAPSYSDWRAARIQVDDTRTLLQAKRRALKLRQGQHDSEGQRIAALTKGLPEAQRQEARLLGLIEETRRTPAGKSVHAPLLLGESARVVSSSRPGSALPWTVLASLVLALIVAWAVERHDGSFHQSDDLRRTLDLPVLGVIPHLRKWRS